MNNDILKFLNEELSRVNNWLHFAEAKLAASIALNIAIIAAFKSSDHMNAVFNLIALVLLIISLILGLLGMLPRSTGTANADNNESDNLLYFGDICKYKSEDYLKAVAEKYFKCTSEEYDEIKKDKRLSDFAYEIITNSRITMVKHRYFKLASIVDFIVLILLVASLIAG